jgi:hypothetical protein
LVGPLHYTNNCNYVFTVIDDTSKWMEAVPLSDIVKGVVSSIEAVPVNK